MTNHHTGLKLYPAKRHHWIAGQRKARARFGGDLNATGNWSAYVPPFEPQSRPGFDPQSCAPENTLRAYITLARYLGFTDFLPDGSERYTGAFAGTTAQGTDPYDVAESIRAYAGIVPQEVMPWTDQTTFETYYDKKMARLNLPLGRQLRQRFVFGYEWIFPFGSNLTPEEKAQKLREYLRRGTVCVSVSGNYRTKRGKLVKDPGERDTHWTLLQREGEINDSYKPQIKKLAANYDHDAAMVYFLKQRVESDRTFWSMIWDTFNTLWKN